MTKNRFFAASVGGAGFQGRFDAIFAPDGFDTVYIIKGGPGTGKSTFMKKLGGEAERRGLSPEYYFCSSDVASLDGVVIPEKRAAVLDGTAPHVTDPKYVGACGRILDFTSAFDIPRLKERRRDIERLNGISGEMFSRAYADLRAAREFLGEGIRVIRASFLQEKATALVRRMTSDLTRGNVTEAGLATVCSRGIYRLDTFFERAERVYTVDAAGGAGYLLMNVIEKAAHAERLRASVSRDPLCPEFAESVFFDEDGVLFTIKRDGDSEPDGEKIKKLNVRRFVSADGERAARPYLRLIKKLYDASIFAAVGALGKASAAHAELEKIYVESTDFSAIDRIYENVKNEIFEN